MSQRGKLVPPGNPNAFGRPRGLPGILAGWIMGWTGLEHNRWAVSQLSVAPGDSVLEVGCGPGVAIRLLGEAQRAGFVAGVDPSPIMVRQARRRNAALARAGRVELREGSASRLPFGNDRFDRVLSVNNVMLWPDPPKDLREVARVMKRGGLLVISLNPRWAKTPGDIWDMGREILSLVTGAGFVAATVEARADLKPFGAVAVAARKPAGI